MIYFCLLLLVFSLALFALGDVAIDLQNGGRLVTGITGEHLAAFYNDLSAIFAGMYQFSFPLLACCEKSINRLTTQGKARLKQRVSALSDSLMGGPSIKFLRASVPVEDDA